jgi:orotate phosphoribosyltransferase
LAVAGCVERPGDVVVGVGSLIDRSGGAATFSLKRVALAAVNAVNYKPEECLMCKAGRTAIKPGSRT